ncbi:MAG: hypothetical protein IT328_12430 [Caldilineaceae bacterium]|nr:hypothetical protein [Caldilineaceae bacterium]
MNPLRVYLDTSVFGGYYDDEFAEITRPFFELIFAQKITPLLSVTLLTEIADAPPQVRALLRQTLPFGEPLRLTPEAVRLQEAYLQSKAVSRRYSDDALHVAQATVARAQVLTSWNFRHMLHPRRTRLFNAVNLVEGYGLLTIMSPFDLTKSIEVNNDKE